MTIDRDKLEKLISLVEQNSLTELTVEEEGLSVTIKAEQQMPAVSSGQQTVQVEVPPVEIIEQSAAETVPEVTEGPSTEHLYEIRSLMIGVFYRRPSPDAKPYVEVGEIIEAGQTVGIIEAMKVFSEVPSEVGGKVVAVPAENGKLVQQDQVLVVIDTSVTE